MTTLADVKTGDQFLFACQVTSTDPTNGVGLSLYGPGHNLAATAMIAPNGAMTGSLASPANTVPVNIVTGFAPVSVGDVMQNSVSGETLVCRWSSINPDGSATWSASTDHQVEYRTAGWAMIGHVDL